MTGSSSAAGAVLTGGASRRFGSDKTQARLGPHRLRDRVAAALVAAGVDPIATIGGDVPTAPDITSGRPRRSAEGSNPAGEGAVGGDEGVGGAADTVAVAVAVAVADDHPGEGPLGGVLTALRWSPAELTVVVAADLPLLDELTVRALLDRARHRLGAVAVARAEGRLQPTCACWPATAGPVLRARFERGERSIIGALDAVAVEPVDVPGRVVADVDTPGDLARLAVVWSR